MKRKLLIIPIIVFTIAVLMGLIFNANITSRMNSLEETKKLSDANHKFSFVATTNSKKIKSGETGTVTLSVEDIHMGDEGLNCVIGYLSYDENLFEEVNISGVGNWKFEINNEKSHELYGKFVIYAMDEGVAQDQDVALITFKLKENVKPQKTEFKFTNVKSSEGDASVNHRLEDVEIEIIDLDNESGEVSKNGQSDTRNETNKDSIDNGTYDNNDVKSAKTGDNIRLISIILVIVASILLVVFIINGKRNNYGLGLKLGIISAVSLVVIGFITIAATCFAYSSEFNSLVNELSVEESVLNSQKYLVTDDCVSRIAPETNIEDAKLNFNKPVKFFNADLSGELNSGRIMTGMKIKDGQDCYSVSVLGDVNGDGSSDQVDLTRIIRNIVSYSKFSFSDVEKSSADMNCDGVVNENDVDTAIAYILYGNLAIPEIPSIAAPKLELSGTYNEAIDAYEGDVLVTVFKQSDNTAKIKYKIEGTDNKEYEEINNGGVVEFKNNGVYKISAISYGIFGNRSVISYKLFVIESPLNDYKIITRTEDVNGNYEENTEVKSGRIGSSVTAGNNIPEGYEINNASSTLSGIVKEEEVIELVVTLDRKSYNIRLRSGDYISSVKIGDEEDESELTRSFKFGKRINISSELESQDGYTISFDRWISSDRSVLDDISNNNAQIEMPMSDIELTATADRANNTDTLYSVEYYYQVNGEYPATADVVRQRSAETGKEVSVTETDRVSTRNGYVCDNTKNQYYTGIVSGSGDLILKVYFKQQFTVTYSSGDHGTFKNGTEIITEETHGGIDYNTETPGLMAQIIPEVGYSFSGWNEEVSQTVTENKVYTAVWIANELDFEGATLNAGVYGSSYTSNTFNAANNGSGNYTYSIKSGAPTGASIDGENRTISLSNTTTAGTYNVEVTATDTTTGKTKDAIFVIVINKQSVGAVTDINVGIDGTISWTNSSNASGFEISFDGTNYESCTNGGNYYSLLTESAGTKKIYVRAVNTDETNYESVDTSIVTTEVVVYSVGFESDNTEYGTVDTSACNVISGSAYETDGSSFVVKAGNKTLKTIRAAKKDITGYTGAFSNWSVTTGTITESMVVIAYFNETPNTYSIVFNANGGSGTMPDEAMIYDTEKELTSNTYSRAGYSFGGWATSENGTAVYADGVKVKNLATSGTYTVYAVWNVNELTFENQTINVIYSTNEQEVDITEARNGTGTYTYSKVLGDAELTVSESGVITIPAEKAANESGYEVVIKATDTNSGAIKDATYTVVIGKQTVNPVTNLSVATDGTILWTNSGNASGYEVSLNGTDFEALTNGVNYLDKITETAGTRTIYIRAINSDSTNYEDADTSVLSTEVSVYTLTIESNNTSYGTVAPMTCNVISGATYEANENKLLVKAGETIIATITATKKDVDGSTTVFSSWSSTGGTISSNKTISANFTRAVNGYIVSFNANGGEGTMNDLEMVYGTAKNLTANTYTKEGYTFSGWATSGNGEVVYADGVEVNNLATSGTYTLYAVWTANELTFENQTINVIYSTNEQEVDITEASNGTGTYTYSKVSGDGDITVTENGKIKIADNKIASSEGYQVIIRATDTNSGAIKDATYTIKIGKQIVNSVTDLTVATDGKVTWTASDNATDYEISFDGNEYNSAESGVDCLANLTETDGEKTIYVRAKNNDDINYESTNTSVANIKINVYILTIESNNTDYGTVDTSSYNVISGATYLADGNKLVVSSGSKVLKTITATKIDEPGYETSLEGWSPDEGTITEHSLIMANFIRNAKNDTKYHVQYYTEDLDGNGYTLEEDVEKQGTTGTTATAEQKTIAGFTYDAENANNNISDIVVADGSTILKLYYTRNSYTITFDANGGKLDKDGTEVDSIEKQYKYQSTYGELPTPTKLGCTFLGWNKNAVPSEYQEVEYIRFNGSQYIDTGIYPTNHTVEAKFDFETYDDDESLFGTAQGSQYYHFTAYGNNYYMGGNGDLGDSFAGTWTTGEHTVIYNDENNSVWLDDSCLIANHSFYAGFEILIGKREGRWYHYLRGKIYYFKITDKTTGNLVRNYIPCYKKSDNSIGLYDTVTNTFYTNNGSGSFTCGDAVGNYLLADSTIDECKDYSVYASWRANELIFENQTISKTYSTEAQTENVTAATNGTGIYTYSKVSGESDIIVSEDGEITIPASKAANESGYEIVIRATDTNTGAIKDATYTIIIGKQTVNPVTDLTVATDGTVTWTNSDNATGYELKIDNGSYAEFTSGSSCLTAITETTGNKKVYVKAINEDSTNYEVADTSIVESTEITVCALTVESNNTEYGTVAPTTCNVISGATYEANENKLLIKAGEEILATVTATCIDLDGYVTEFTGWSSNGGTITDTTSVTANFTRAESTHTPKVGDIVNYNANINNSKEQYETPYSSKPLYGKTGSTINNTFSSSDQMVWKILSIDENTGTVELVSADGTPNLLYVYGRTGFVNYEDILNEVSEVYGHGFGAESSRSITLDDVEQYSSFDRASSQGYEKQYSETTEFTNGGYFFKEKSKSYGEDGSIYIKYEDEVSAASSSSPISITQNYYVYEADSYYSNMDVYNMLFNDSSGNLRNYWLNSRCSNIYASISPGYCNFLGNSVFDGYVGADHLAYSHNSSSQVEINHKVCPVVTLKNEARLVWNSESNSWDIELYTINYDLDGGTLENENPTCYAVDSDDITLNNPTKEGAKFIGWTGSNGDTPELTVTIPTGSTGDKSYTANWDK